MNDETKAGRPSDSSFILHPSSLLIFALLVAARLWRLWGPCLWFDEVFSAHAARQGWRAMLHFVAADVIHPPLFYALLKAWVAVGGDSLVWLRLFPFLFAVAAVVPFLLLCRELRLGRGETQLALLLLAANGYLIKYAQELRMYSLLLFLALFSLWLFVKFYRAGGTSARWLAALTAVNLLLVYTHYYGWVLVATEGMFLLLWARARVTSFLLSAALLVLAYCPWAYALAKSAEPGRGLGQNIGWVARPALADLAQYLVLLNKPFVFAQSNVEASYDLRGLLFSFALFGPPLALLFRRALTREGETPSRTSAEGACAPQTLRLLFFFSFVPALLVFLLSQALPYSVWGTRHLIIASGPYSILAALALSNLRPYWAKVTALLVLGSWLFLAAAYLLFKPAPHYTWCAWEELAGEMVVAESGSAGDVGVYAYEDLVAYHLWFALETRGESRFRVNAIKGVPGINEDTAYFLPRAFDGVTVKEKGKPEGERVWAAFRAPEWDESGPPLEWARAAGYRVGRVLSLKALGETAFMVELLRERK